MSPTRTMTMFRSFTAAMLCQLSLVCLPAICRAGITYDVTFFFGANTTSHYGTAFAFDATLTGGTGANTITLANFALGGGAVVSPAWYATGSNFPPGSQNPSETGMSGDLSSAVSITDTDGNGNEFTEGFTAGGSLTFQLTLPDNPALGDNLTLRLINSYDPNDNSGNYIPTTSLLDTSIFMSVDLTSSPTFQLYSSADSSSDITISAQPEAGGGSSAVVPEPSTLAMLLIGLGGFAARGGRKRNGQSFLSARVCRAKAVVDRTAAA